MMEMKALLSAILRKYEITTDIPFDTFDAATEPALVLRPGDGVLVQIKERSPMGVRLLCARTAN